MQNRLKIGFIPQYDINYASSRYRVFQFIPLLQECGFTCHILPAPMFNNVKRLIYLPRLLTLARSCDVLFLQKRTFPMWIANLVLRINSRLIYDYDDAIYLQPDRGEQFHHILRKACLVVAGNTYLSSYANTYNKHVVVIPSVVDTDLYIPQQVRQNHSERQVVIGWIGSDPNRGDLNLIADCLDKLALAFQNKVMLRTIARNPYSRDLKIKQQFTPWSLHTARQVLQQIDIGIMPLENTEWNRGKCAFKLIQYSSVGAATIASPIGANKYVVLHGKTGFLADTSDEWFDYMKLLIQDVRIRSVFGNEGRLHIQKNYSLKVWLPELVKAITYGEHS